MRALGFLVVAGALLCAACTPTTSPDEDCITQGGTCFISEGVCGIAIQAACSSGYSCCSTTSINAYNVRDGGLFDAGPLPIVREGGADALPDGSHDAAHESSSDADAAKTDSGHADAGENDASKPDAGVDAGKPLDSGVDASKNMDASDAGKSPTDSGDSGKTADASTD